VIIVSASRGDLGNCILIGDKRQNVPLATFHRLEANDILFVDSSHVSKIGSDVNRIVFDVLPILKPCVLVHFHDGLWPCEYPIWKIVEGKAWNEAYHLRAFLQYNSHFETVLFNSFVGHTFKEYIESNMPMFLQHGWRTVASQDRLASWKNSIGHYYGRN